MNTASLNSKDVVNSVGVFNDVFAISSNVKE